MCQKTVTIDFFTHKSVKNNGLETQYFIEGHHDPIVKKSDWLTAQQIRKERRYTKNRSRRGKPRYIVKGPLAGFLIVNPDWETEYIESLFQTLSTQAEPAMSPLLEDDENFTISKE